MTNDGTGGGQYKAQKSNKLQSQVWSLRIDDKRWQWWCKRRSSAWWAVLQCLVLGAVLGGQGVASALRNKPRTHIIFQRASSFRMRT